MASRLVTLVLVLSLVALARASTSTSTAALRAYYTSSDCSSASFDKAQPIEYLTRGVCVPDVDTSSISHINNGVVQSCVYATIDCTGESKCIEVGSVGACEKATIGYSMVSAVKSNSQSIVVREYLDAFCGTAQTTENFMTNECAPDMDAFTMYMVSRDGMVHCDFANAECKGMPTKCVLDQATANKCTQSGQGISSRIDWESVQVHALSFEEENFGLLASSSSGRSSTGRYSSTGGSDSRVSLIDVRLYRNSTQCYLPQRGGASTVYYTYNNGVCQSSVQTPSRMYSERITVNGDSSVNGQWCRYSGPNCNTLYDCETIYSGKCSRTTVLNYQGQSIEFWYGGYIDLGGLAAFIIVIIVISVLVVCGGIITACCCAGAFAALLGRLCCGLCFTSQQTTQTSYHVRLTN